MATKRLCCHISHSIYLYDKKKNSNHFKEITVLKMFSNLIQENSDINIDISPPMRNVVCTYIQMTNQPEYMHTRGSENQ